MPTRPNSSPITAMMKSVWLSGRKSRCDWVPSSQPLPNTPPEPMAALDWMMFQPVPSGSLSGSRKVRTRCFW
ncbi:hypothetical protein D3C85_1117240 [compost metagenome]